MVLLGPLLGDEMPHELCHQFGFDRSAIIERVNLLGLGGPSVPMIAAELQSHVIEPNVDGIIEDFYEALERSAEFQAMVQERDRINRLKMTQRKYLLSLGREFNSLDYFESRLRVGAAHERAGVSLSLYQSFYCQLQNMLLSLIPDEIRQKPDAFAELGIAEPAHRPGTMPFAARPEIAAGETQEHGGSARLRALALQGVVDFLDGIHDQFLVVVPLASRPADKCPERVGEGRGGRDESPVGEPSAVACA